VGRGSRFEELTILTIPGRCSILTEARYQNLDVFWKIDTQQQSGVALRLPPQSKARPHMDCGGKAKRRHRFGLRGTFQGSPTRQS